MSQTIFALATAPGRAGITVVRISGPRASAALGALSGRPPPPPRVATLMGLADPDGGAVLDRGLALWFPAPASYTGEDVVELHLHGGTAVAGSVIAALAGQAGLRPAEPGEFTRRAFENGKLDLTEAEAIADLVDAETTAQQRQALRQMAGELGRLYDGWRSRLKRTLAHLEAELDFPDEELPTGVADRTSREITALRDEIDRHLDDGRRGERLRQGLYIAILGPPNAGKSSLLNALARRDAAIVSDRAGTTRDVIEVHLDLAGFPVTLADTAGLQETGDEIEDEGVRRALARAEYADLKVLLFDVRAPTLDPATLALVDGDSVVVFNKIDLAADAGVPAIAGHHPVSTSAKTGEGLDALLDRLRAMAAARLTGDGGPALTRARHRAALEDCRAGLNRSLTAPQPELTAEDLRLAMRALGRITGRVDVEELLDVIFRDFCIGK